MLVAIAIPIFTTQLEKSREATDMSNVRAAYAEVVAAYLTDNAATSATVTAQQAQASWQNTENGNLQVRVNGSESTIPVPAVTKGGQYVIAIDASGNVSVTASGS